MVREIWPLCFYAIIFINCPVNWTIFFVLGFVLAHFNVIPTVATMAISAPTGISGAMRKMAAPGTASCHCTSHESLQDRLPAGGQPALTLYCCHCLGPTQSRSACRKIPTDFNRSCSRPTHASQPEAEFITNVLKTSNSKQKLRGWRSFSTRMHQAHWICIYMQWCTCEREWSVREKKKGNFFSGSEI